MTNEYLYNLLRFYRKAIVGELDQETLGKEILKTRKDLDTSFVTSGKEDHSIANYLDELLTIQSSLHYE